MGKRKEFREFFRLARNLKSGVLEFEATDSSKGVFGKQPMRTAPLKKSNVIASRHLCVGGRPMHRVVLDIDIDAALVPSSTEGHFHLLIDKLMPWEDYAFLLKSLYTVGLIQKGYYEASINRKETVIRTPWAKKCQAPLPA